MQQLSVDRLGASTRRRVTLARSAARRARRCRHPGDHELAGRRRRSAARQPAVRVQLLGGAPGPPRGRWRRHRRVRRAPDGGGAAVRVRRPRRARRQAGRARCVSASSHVGAASACPGPTSRNAAASRMGSSSRRRAIARDYPGRAGGTQPRLRGDRRVAYSRPPDGSDVPPHRRAARRGRAPARRRAGRGPVGDALGAGLADALRRRRLGRARRRPRQRAPDLRLAPRLAAHAGLGQQALHHRHRADALRRRRAPDHARARRRRRRPRGRADRQPLPARRRRPELRLAPGRRARRRARARPGPARDHRARDRRRVGLRLAARRGRRRATARRARSGR